MEYAWRGDTAVLRLEIGEDIIESVSALCKKEKIEAAYITGIGALRYAAVGVYNMATGVYNERLYDEFCEVTGLCGNASTMDGETYIHLHASLARQDTSVVGGHLKKGVVGATAEIFITRLPGKIERVHDEESGLNIFAL
ncbi:MAG: DNA-binding protein [Clostridia bacterium]|nr:DNA-binding protein [Clostridia bacterium]